LFVLYEGDFILFTKNPIVETSSVDFVDVVNLNYNDLNTVFSEEEINDLSNSAPELIFRPEMGQLVNSISTLYINVFEEQIYGISCWDDMPFECNYTLYGIRLRDKMSEAEKRIDKQEFVLQGSNDTFGDGVTYHYYSNDEYQVTLAEKEDIIYGFSLATN